MFRRIHFSRATSPGVQELLPGLAVLASPVFVDQTLGKRRRHLRDQALARGLCGCCRLGLGLVFKEDFVSLDAGLQTIHEIDSPVSHGNEASAARAIVKWNFTALKARPYLLRAYTHSCSCMQVINQGSRGNEMRFGKLRVVTISTEGDTIPVRAIGAKA
jgi:hypothetical protein